MGQGWHCVHSAACKERFKSKLAEEISGEMGSRTPFLRGTVLDPKTDSNKRFCADETVQTDDSVQTARMLTVIMVTRGAGSMPSHSTQTHTILTTARMLTAQHVPPQIRNLIACQCQQIANLQQGLHRKMACFLCNVYLSHGPSARHGPKTANPSKSGTTPSISTIPMAMFARSSSLPNFVKNKKLTVHRWIMDWEVVRSV